MSRRVVSLPGLYGLLAGIIILSIALDIILLARGIIDLLIAVIIDLVLIGVILIMYSFKTTDRSDKIYYSFWGLILFVVSGSMGFYRVYSDIVSSIAILLAGIGGLIIYASIMQK